MRQYFEKNNIDLTIEQYFMLNILDRKEGLILQDIADMAGKDKSAITRHINALGKKHFVTRATCEEDKRKKLLILTKPGMKTLQKAQKVSKEAEDELIDQIDEEQIEIFERVLAEIMSKAQDEV